MKIIDWLRKNFFTGLIVLIPIAVVTWVALGLFNLLSQIYEILPQSLRPEDDLALIFDLFLSLGALLALIVLIGLLGWLSKLYLGQKALGLFRKLVKRIPVIGTIYGSLDQLIKMFAGGTDKQFDRVVYVEYPRKDILTIGFVTGDVSGPKAPEKHLSVFVPTVPNPTSGFYLMVPAAEVREAGISVEEAFKTILSLGVSQPEARGSSGAP